MLDLAGEIPVLVAGGIATGRGVAAALAMGAAGAVLGTRFKASEEYGCSRAGESAGLVDRVRPAGEIVRALVAETEGRLRAVGQMIS